MEGSNAIMLLLRSQKVALPGKGAPDDAMVGNEVGCITRPTTSLL